MHILLKSRPDIFSQPGGDSIHLRETARYLELLGYRVSLLEPDPALGAVDLWHYFNLNRPQHLVDTLKKGHPPLVVSSIFVNYIEADAESSPARKKLQALFGEYGLEYLKGVAKGRQKKLRPGFQYLLKGHRQSIQKTLDHTAYLITASKAEAEMILNDFNYQGELKSLTLGHEHLPPAKSAAKGDEIISVARFEPLKNQLRLIKACNKLNLRLRLVGTASKQHRGYLEQCKNIASARTAFYGAQDHEEVACLLNKSKVHVLASSFETTGLASIEALVNGCQIVVNDHPIQRELFGEHAHYCQAHSEESIANAISKALKTTVDHSDWAREKFSWLKSVRELSNIYQHVLSSKVE
jgi:glycosyltransferase involved in cell wall biosynthesis